jgi:hypothetical protein
MARQVDVDALLRDRARLQRQSDKLKERVDELEEQVEVQSKMVDGLSTDANRGHHFGMAVVAMTAATEHLQRAGLTSEARMILSMTHNVEVAYLNARMAPVPSPGETSKGASDK